MARIPRRSRRSSSQSSALYKYIVGGAALIAVAVLMGSALLRANSPKFDAQTLCTNTEPPRVTLILVDATDTLNAVQRASIANQIEQIVTNLEEGERVELFSVSGDADLLSPLFDRCRPSDGSRANIAIANPEKIAKQYRAQFIDPLQQSFAGLIVNKESTSTPLMRAIQAASVKGFGRWPASTKRRLIIVSDLLEYDGGRDHYQPIDAQATNFKTAEYDRLRTDLKGASVELWYIRRATSSDVQGVSHIEFWQSYFTHLNGVVERVFPVEG